jgi:hypothetical protein
MVVACDNNNASMKSAVEVVVDYGFLHNFLLPR